MPPDNSTWFKYMWYRNTCYTAPAQSITDLCSPSATLLHNSSQMDSCAGSCDSAALKLRCLRCSMDTRLRKAEWLQKSDICKHHDVIVLQRGWWACFAVLPSHRVKLRYGSMLTAFICIPYAHRPYGSIIPERSSTRPWTPYIIANTTAFNLLSFNLLYSDVNNCACQATRVIG
mgnify:CR=1 FL=1